MTDSTDQVVKATALATSVKGLVTRDAISTTSVDNLITGDVVVLYIGVSSLATRDTTPTTVTRATILIAASNGLITGPLAPATTTAKLLVW